MTAAACDPAVVGALAVLQSAFPVMPMPEGVASFIEAGLQRVPGVASARLNIRMEPLDGSGDAVPAIGERIWLQTANGRFGWLDLVVADPMRFEAYDPYVRNLANDVAMHVESAHQQAQLEKMVAALREADRRKDELLNMLSHELRNPLAPIRTSIYLLEHAAPGSEQARRSKEVIRRQAEHLTRLVDDLLDVKRLSTGKLRIHAVRLDLVRHLRDAVDDMRPLFERRAIALELSAPAEPVWVNGDATRLAQIATNLLHNASKFTNPGGHVRVSVERGGGQARLRVRDDGLGVDPELLPRMFEPFVQGESTLERTAGGLGLGLSLVRGIAELHGGTVRAESDGFDKGTEIVVTLPITEPPVAIASGVARAAPPSRRRVLVVEDNRDSAESLRDVLETIGGHEVHVASDGATAVEAARQHAPDVILCDLGLPVIDGYEAARRIRAATGAERDSRLVALSGYAAPGDVERSLRAGFDYHVAKPPDVDGLLRLIADAPGGAPTSERLTAAPRPTGHEK